METKVLEKSIEKPKAFNIKKFDIFKNFDKTLCINLQVKSNLTNLTNETFDLTIKDIYLIKNFIPDITASMLTCNILKEIVFNYIIKPLISIRDYLYDYDDAQNFRLHEFVIYEHKRDNMLIYFDEQEIQHFKDELVKQLEMLKS